MSLSPHRTVDLEQSLIDLQEAERVGVFARTRLPVEAFHVVSRGGVIRFRGFLARGLSAAAVLAVALVGIRSWSGVDGLSGASNRLGDASLLASADGCDGTFFGCVGGPGGSLSTPCRDFDFDHDGDVDLADTMAYQRGCTGLQR